MLDEKSELKKIQEELQTKLNSVATNQSILQDNLASIYTKVENLSSQVFTYFLKEPRFLVWFGAVRLGLMGFHEFYKEVSVNSYKFRFRLVRALHIQNSSKCCRHKYNPSISRIFHAVGLIWAETIKTQFGQSLQCTVASPEPCLLLKIF